MVEKAQLLQVASVHTNIWKDPEELLPGAECLRAEQLCVSAGVFCLLDQQLLLLLPSIEIMRTNELIRATADPSKPQQTPTPLTVVPVFQAGPFNSFCRGGGRVKLVVLVSRLKKRRTLLSEC